MRWLYYFCYSWLLKGEVSRSIIFILDPTWPWFGQSFIIKTNSWSHSSFTIESNTILTYLAINFGDRTIPITKNKKTSPIHPPPTDGSTISRALIQSIRSLVGQLSVQVDAGSRRRNDPAVNWYLHSSLRQLGTAEAGSYISDLMDDSWTGFCYDLRSVGTVM